jgi:hypothetical protein
MRHIARIVVFLSLMTAAVAQAKPAVPTAKFHLPAGTHSVPQLLELASQAVRSPVGLGHDVEAAALEPLRLQRDLVLSSADWEEGLSALLETRGLVVTFDAANRRHEVMVIPTQMTDWLRERARTMTLAELAASPGARGPVQLTLQPAHSPELLGNMLRPYLVQRPVAITSEVEGQTLVLTSLAPNLRFALGVFIGLDATLAASWPAATPPAWPRAATGDHTLAAGSYTIGELVDALAHRLGRNIPCSAAVTALDQKIKVDEPIRGDSLVFEARLSSLLWQHRVLVLELAPHLDLHEAVHVAEPRRLPLHRAQSISAPELLARPDLVALVRVPYAIDQGSIPAAMAKIRAIMGKGAVTSVTVGTSEVGMMFEGLSVHVALMLQEVASVPKTADK